MAIESPTNDFGKGAKGAKSAVGFIQKARQVAQVLVKGGTGPVGWLATAAQLLAPLIKKIRKAAAIIGGMIGLQILMHIMQLVGLVTGLAFGAISGLPLLLIPGAGPFLYAGWTAYWGFRGFTNPFDTIQLATHPWELITRPLSWLGQRFSDLGAYFKGGTEYVGSGVGNAASAVFYSAANFLTGLASSIWGWTTSIIGNTVGWLGGVAGHALGLASTLTSSVASIASVGVYGTVAVFGVGSLLVATNYVGALTTTEGDVAQNITTPGINDFFTITKTADPTQLASTSDVVTFSITLTAKSQAITKHTMTDLLRYQKNGVESAPITKDNRGYDISLALQAGCPEPTPIPASTSCSTITIPITPSLASIPSDSTIINTVTVNATMADGSTKTDSVTVTVRVGNPTAVDPSGWPSCGYIAQGPYQDPTHNHFRSYSAVDIQKDDGMGDNVYATQDGTIVAVMTESTNPLGGNGVIISGANYATLYAHFGLKRTDGGVAPGIYQGKWVTAGTLIGYRGNSGDAILPHVHYSILTPAPEMTDILEKDFRALVPPFAVGDTVPSTWGPCR